MKLETPSVKILLQRAKELGIKTKPMSGTPIIEYSYKDTMIRFDECFSSRLGNIGALSCIEKNINKNLLRNAKINTPNWVEFYADTSEQDIIKYSNTLKFPVVVKPYDGTHAENITMNLKNAKQVLPAVKKLQKITSVVLVEEMFEAEEIRIYATRKKFLAAVKRRPASVLGDGKHTIKELVKIKNSDPKRSKDYNNTLLRPLKIAKQELKILKKQRQKSSSVPKKGRRVYLQDVSNISCGGDSIDITDKVHRSVKKIAVKAIRAIPELPFGGIDFMTTDYTKRQSKKRYSILEINCNARINLHHYPYEGESRDVAGEILKQLFKI